MKPRHQSAEAEAATIAANSKQNQPAGCVVDDMSANILKLMHDAAERSFPTHPG